MITAEEDGVMPYKARKNSNTGSVVNASQVTINEKDDRFYCITPRCDAVMKAVNVGNIEEAYFRRLPSSPYHISANCMRCGITFEKTKYDESKFTTQRFADWVLSEPSSSHKGTTGTKIHKVGGGSMGFHSLGTIYKMCVSLGKNEKYNGVLIDDIFVDEENYSRYNNSLNGFLVVECSFYKKVYKESSLLFNYPTNFKEPHIIVRMNFANEELCWKYYKKFEGCHHTEPIAIAGVWRPENSNSEAQFECDYVSSRQIYVVK